MLNKTIFTSVKQHNEEQSLMNIFPKQIWGHVFSFLRVRDKLPVSMTCVHFHGIFAQRNLKESFLKRKIEFSSVSDAELSAAMIQCSENFDLTIHKVVTRIINGQSPLSLLKKLLKNYPIAQKISIDSLFDLTNRAQEQCQILILELQLQLAPYDGCYQGMQEAKNPYFMDLVSALSRLNERDVNTLPMLKTTILKNIQLAYLTLPKDCREFSKLETFFQKNFILTQEQQLIHRP